MKASAQRSIAADPEEWSASFRPCLGRLNSPLCEAKTNMNMMRRVCHSLILACVIILPWICHAADHAWKPYVKYDPFISSYDPSSVTRPSKDIVRVLVKDECSDKEKCREVYRKWIAESKGLMKAEYERFAYRISSAEMQCKAGKIRYLSKRNVDENGKTLDEFRYGGGTAWMDVRNPWNEPNDPQEELWKLLCK